MPERSSAPQQSKISRAFATRLNRLGPRQKVQAIVMLRTGDARVATTQRRSRSNRQAAIEAMRKSAQQALVEIDTILERFSGRRLAHNPDALGSIPVETTAAGISALAESPYVKAILEDQPISLLAGSGR